MDGRLLLTSVFIWRQIYVISPFLLFETGNIAFNVFYSFYLLFWISNILRLESQLILKFYQQNLQTQNFNCVWVRSYTKQYKKVTIRHFRRNFIPYFTWRGKRIFTYRFLERIYFQQLTEKWTKLPPNDSSLSEFSIHGRHCS